MKIATILPVSRIEYLDLVIESLLNQSYKPHTSLLTVVDGSNDLYIKVRNKLASSGLEEVLCIQSRNYGDVPNDAIPQRRRRITNIHNQIRSLITSDTDYIFSIEDDGILPRNALWSLKQRIEQLPDAGIVTGVELGRWDVPYVGAWLADDIFRPRELISVRSKAGQELAEEVDACGLYCSLTRADLYKEHIFTCNNGLGPDINLGLDIRQKAFKNYIDWSVLVDHMTQVNGELVSIPANSKSVSVTMFAAPDGRTWLSVQ